MTETEYLSHLDQINWEEFKTQESANWPHDIWCNKETCQLDGVHCENFDRKQRETFRQTEDAEQGSRLLGAWAGMR